MAHGAEVLPSGVARKGAVAGRLPSRGQRRLPPRWFAAVVGVVAIAVAAPVVLRPRHDATYVGNGGSVQEPVTPGASFNAEGRTPTAFPVTKSAVGFLTLDQPIREAVVALGPPTSSEPDINGTTTRIWELDAAARWAVSAWDDTDEISGLFASVPPGSRVRIGVFGGITIGESTLREVVAAWGGAFTAAASPFDDFVVSYIDCVGPYPVVVKFDQADAGEERFAPAAEALPWDEPVTSVLVAYADEPPGSAGCPPPPS